MHIVRQWLHTVFSDTQLVILFLVLVVCAAIILSVGDLLAPVIASVIIAFLLEGLVRVLEGFRWPRMLAVCLVFGMFMLFLAVLLFAHIREISTMADMAVSMLHRALGAFIAEDLDTARSLPAEDDQVDELYKTIYRKIVQGMIADPSSIDHSNQILWVIHNIERTADRVTNICERIVFIATGELLEMDSSDDELESPES